MQSALAVGLRDKKPLVRDRCQNRHGAVRRQTPQRDVLAQKRARAILRQARAPAGHELDVLEQRVLPLRLALRGLVRVQQPVPHARVDREEEEKEHDAVLVRDAPLLDQVRRGCERRGRAVEAAVHLRPAAQI